MSTFREGTPEAVRLNGIPPPHIVASLGAFDLDVCAPVNPPNVLATRSYTKQDDGLSQPWEGRVWCNPPYDVPTSRRFIERCVEHKNCTALIFARTDTRIWQELIFPHFKAIKFIKGRIRFIGADGLPAQQGAGAPSALIAFDEYNARRLVESDLQGYVMTN